jgi:predicted nucleic acid-binding protein
LSFDLRKSLRRIKPEQRTVGLIRRPDDALSFVSNNSSVGSELLLDTCVYIDAIQDRIPAEVANLFAVRRLNHSGVALAELTHLLGRLDPKDGRTERAYNEISGVISDMGMHRLHAPSLQTLGEAGILAGLTARLAGVESRRRQTLLNDAMLYLQASEQGHTLLTRNIREFDWFDQLFPNGRVLFYRQPIGGQAISMPLE